MPSEKPAPVNASFLKETGFRNGTVLMMAKGHFFIGLGKHPVIEVLMNALAIAVDAHDVNVFVAGIVSLALFPTVAEDPDEVI